MDLKESLEKFKKQQERSQSTLSSIVARQPASRTAPSQRANTSNASPAFTSRPPVKFSSDSDRLQHINNIRKAPVGAQIKRVLHLLYEMDLKESLEKFKKQQERSQSTLSSIAARQPASRTEPSQRANTSNASPAFTSRPPVKFSSDSDRLEHINNIRKAPVGAQIKRVLHLLYETRASYTPEQINEACFVDINGNKAVLDSLKNNLKVHYDGKQFSYKAKHDVKDKNGLLYLIRNCAEGIPIIDLKDAYPNVMEDLQGLKAGGQIWVLSSNSDSQEDIAYPNDPRITIKVDVELKHLYQSIELPRDMLDVEKDLRKNGMKPATNTAQRRAAAQMGIIAPNTKPKTTKHVITKRTKLTNVHLPELFQL